eukprot:COSAG06_NODE_21569_length_752_cov_9.246554_1_plen_98_part_00
MHAPQLAAQPRHRGAAAVSGAPTGHCWRSRGALKALPELAHVLLALAHPEKDVRRGLRLQAQASRDLGVSDVAGPKAIVFIANEYVCHHHDSIVLYW